MKNILIDVEIRDIGVVKSSSLHLSIFLSVFGFD